MVGRHTKSCADAKGETCNCTGCGGSEHGWSGGLWLAAAGTEVQRNALGATLDKNWRSNSKSLKRRAAVAMAKLDLIKWLARNWNTRATRTKPTRNQDRTGAEPKPQSVLQKLARLKGQEPLDLRDEALVTTIDELGSALTKEVLDAVDAAFPEEARHRDARRQLAKHFWCDLFTGLAHAISEFENTLNKVPEWTTQAVLGSPHQGSRSLIQRAVVELAAEQAWKVVEQAIKDHLGTEKALLTLRLLAILCCPAPAKHPAVITYCLVPLGNAVLEAEVKAKLKAVLSEELTRELNLDPVAPNS